MRSTESAVIAGASVPDDAHSSEAAQRAGKESQPHMADGRERTTSHSPEKAPVSAAAASHLRPRQNVSRIVVSPMSVTSRRPEPGSTPPSVANITA